MSAVAHVKILASRVSFFVI